MAKSKHDPKVPTVTLGGKEWLIPPLAIRQQREVWAPIVKLNGLINEVKDGKVAEAFYGLTNDEWNALILKPVYVALTKANPELNEDEFLDMVVSGTDLIGAWFVVREQSRIFLSRGDSDLGEAKAARKSPTGT